MVTPRLHAVHELEDVALEPAAAGEAVEQPIGEIHREARMLVVMEGAAHLDLVAFSGRGEAVVGEDGAEIRARLDRLEVHAIVLCHVAPVRRA
jgi:imidazoleglycerol phosphate dehydratase HisB